MMTDVCMWLGEHHHGAMEQPTIIGIKIDDNSSF